MSTETIPNHHVADRAYYLWEQAGRPHGRDLEFWTLAEADIRAASKPNNSDLARAYANQPLQALHAAPPPLLTGPESRPRTKQSPERTPRKTAPRSRQP